MTVELAGIRAVPKPWGCADLAPWSTLDAATAPIGELWFDRSDAAAPPSALLLKLLFTTEPLSVQVHPDDAFARSMDLPNGKTEAWHILSATPGARIALGLKRALTPAQLRAAIADSSISQLVQWQRVAKGETVFVPARTIHAIGAGLVLAEIQQRSDTTYRLFDYGRARELHAEAAVAVADAGPAQPQPVAKRLSDERSLLVANPYFVMERIALLPGTQWTLNAARETWLLMLSGEARIQGASASRRDALNLGIGQALFAEADRVTVTVGSDGMTALVAYGGPEPAGDLLELSEADGLPSAARSASRQPARPLTVTEAAS